MIYTECRTLIISKWRNYERMNGNVSISPAPPSYIRYIKGLLPSVRHRGSHNSDKLKGSKHSDSFLAKLPSFQQKKMAMIVIKELTKPWRKYKNAKKYTLWIEIASILILILYFFSSKFWLLKVQNDLYQKCLTFIVLMTRMGLLPFFRIWGSQNSEHMGLPFFRNNVLL